MMVEIFVPGHARRCGQAAECLLPAANKQMSAKHRKALQKQPFCINRYREQGHKKQKDCYYGVLHQEYQN